MSEPDWECQHALIADKGYGGYGGYGPIEIHCDLKESHVAKGEPHETTVTQEDWVFLPDGASRREKATYRVTWKKERTDG